MEQVEAIAILAQAAKRANALVVSDIGSQTVWLHATGDRAEYFYLTGPMGLAASVGLGVALGARSRPVLAICGDGALTMSLNSLATLSDCAPANLTLAVMDNGVYDFTGKIPAPCRAVAWEGVRALFPGFGWFEELREESNPHFSADRGLGMIRAKVAPATTAPPKFPLEPVAILARFAQAAQAGNPQVSMIADTNRP